MYGADTLACIAIGDQNRPEGPGFFACSCPTAPKESLVCPQITRCNHSPNPPSSVRASYSVLNRNSNTAKAHSLREPPPPPRDRTARHARGTPRLALDSRSDAAPIFTHTPVHTTHLLCAVPYYVLRAEDARAHALTPTERPAGQTTVFASTPCINHTNSHLKIVQCAIADKSSTLPIRNLNCTHTHTHIYIYIYTYIYIIYI